MIEVHFHCLPGIDDGPSDWDEAVALCRAAAAVYQGLPIDLFGGVRLYHEVSDTHIPYAALNQAARKKLFDHTIRSDASARSVAESAGSSGP